MTVNDRHDGPAAADADEHGTTNPADVDTNRAAGYGERVPDMQPGEDAAEAGQRQRDRAAEIEDGERSEPGERADHNT